ncbi:MAG: SDR family NAD(P)-dependent oxidoreductase [Desulfatiglandales bacterium]|nr:SDR family NAD(P)-dependent oxidoreductase [Desulfatiglandales bacterium]
MGENALVTGARRGIGRAIVTGLARVGANVVINHYNNEAAAEEVKKDIEKSGRTAIVVKADVSKKEDVGK